MKKIIATILLSVFCLSSYAATYLDVWLRWNYDTATTNLVHSFVVYCARDNSTNFVPVVTVPATTNVAKARMVIVPGVTKKLTFKVTAKNDVGESPLSTSSDSVPKTTPVNIPTDVTIFGSTTITNQ